MKLTQSQKNELQKLFSNTNDSFFSFLDHHEYEKKHKKFKNAKDEYAKLSFDEEALFLLDDTDFGSARDGIVITNKTIYFKNTFEDKQFIKLEDISSCELVREGGSSVFDNSGIIKINNIEISMDYFRNTTGMVVDIIKKLVEFYKQHIIQTKSLDIYSTITIPYSLSQSGGKFKDSVSGYDITIPKGVKDGTVWSWEDYGKSYGNTKGKLTVTVQVEQPIYKPKQEVKNIYVDCVNCGKAHLNPTSYDCVFCGKSLTKFEKKLEKKLSAANRALEALNDLGIDEQSVELIVSCVNCDKEIKNYSSDICPHCGQDANVKKKEAVKTKPKLKSSFALNLDENITVKELQDEFRTNTGLFLRVYDGRSQARANKKVSNLEAKGEVEVSTRMKIETIENAFKDVGLKVQIASPDNEKLCDNKLSLAKAKEKYSKGKKLWN